MHKFFVLSAVAVSIILACKSRTDVSLPRRCILQAEQQALKALPDHAHNLKFFDVMRKAEQVLLEYNLLKGTAKADYKQFLSSAVKSQLKKVWEEKLSSSERQFLRNAHLDTGLAQCIRQAASHIKNPRLRKQWKN